MLTTAKHKAKKSQFIAIELDETQYWTDEVKQYCDKIMCVYYYDASQVTYCCEITPSYWLVPVYSYAHYKQEVYDLPQSECDKIQEIIDDIIMQGDGENRDGSYYHVTYIDGLPNTCKKPLKDANSIYYAPDGKKHRQLEAAVLDLVYENKPFC